MSFWDHIKPAPRVPAAVQVEIEDEGRCLHLVWEDGPQTRVGARALRQFCPCAQCVEEWSGKRTFDPEDIPDPLAPENIMKGSGRGILFMRNYMDDVSLSRHPEGGMQIWMKKRRTASAAP